MPKKKKALKPSKKKKLKPLAVVVFEPKYGIENPDLYHDAPLKPGEQVIFLGGIPNVAGHCAVAKHSGEIVWLMHPEDFRMAREDEI